MATSARRREEESAAHFLTAELKTFEVFASVKQDIERHFENLKKLARDPDKLRGTPYEIKIILDPIHVRPRLSQLFEQSMSRVMRVNTVLASHLTVFWQAARAAEHRLAESERELLSQLEFFKEVTVGGECVDHYRRG